MPESAFFLRGLVIGFSIAAPVGPIGVLCIRRTLAEGRAVGFVSGLGAATADAAYGSIAALGLSAVTTLLVGHQTWLRLIGGAFLCYLGYRIFVSRPAENVTGPPDTRLAGAYTSTLLLTLTNPMTILSFAAVFAGLGLGGAAGGLRTAALMVLGVFLGSALWWTILSGVTGLLRARLEVRGLRWVNRLSGMVITAFGIAALAAGARGK
jgi:threonine/homoserine/homoserine lactone efflux protein